MKFLCFVFLLTVSALSGWATEPPSARTDLANFSFALKMFDDECGRYPTTAEGLDALIHRPPNVPTEKWRKYLDVARMPMDPWGHPYVYRCPGVHNTNLFDIYSCGPDGKSKSGGGDPDDINNWNPNSPLVSGQPDESSKTLETVCIFAAMVILLALAVRLLGKNEGNPSR
ncbi:MAG: type II secretion system protein GspG [Verrucomicrobiota bacterium]|jgi:general secretion pathway protein G